MKNQQHTRGSLSLKERWLGTLTICTAGELIIEHHGDRTREEWNDIFQTLDIGPDDLIANTVEGYMWKTDGESQWQTIAYGDDFKGTFWDTLEWLWEHWSSHELNENTVF